MKEQLIIKNVGALKHINIEIKGFTVFIGPQAAGKSTIAKIVSIIKSITVLAGIDKFEDEIEKYGISNYFNPNSYIQFHTKNYTFKFENTKANFEFKNKSLIDILKAIKELNEKTTYEDILNENEKKRKNFLKITRSIEKKLAGLSDDNIGSIKAQLPKISAQLDSIKKEWLESVSLQNFYIEQLNQFANFTNYSCYIPAERTILSVISDALFSLMNKDIALPYTIIRFGKIYQEARLKFANWDIPVFNNIIFSHSNNEDFLIFKTTKKKLKLNQSSSGLQAIIPLLLVLENLKITSVDKQIGTGFVIEEPELNLFPEAQHKLIDYIASRINSYSDILITTHSPYILSSINNLLLRFAVKQKKPNLNIKGSTIDPKDFLAYYINNGKARKIYNQSLGLISENEIDNVSEYILNEFESLNNLHP